MNKKEGFTLAEVLITLVIIGVIAAMTIPTLMQNTQSQEYRSALKKAIATLNEGLTMQYAIDSTTLSDYTTNATTALTAVFMNRLNVMETAATGSIAGATRYSVFYTADGMKFGFTTSGVGSSCNADGSTPCWSMLVDINGDKGPNSATTSATDPKDVYAVTLYATRAIPLNATISTRAYVTQDVMYN